MLVKLRSELNMAAQVLSSTRGNIKSSIGPCMSYIATCVVQTFRFDNVLIIIGSYLRKWHVLDPSSSSFKPVNGSQLNSQSN